MVRFSSIRNYSSLVKLSHAVFSMPFAVVGFLLGTRDAGGKPDWLIFLWVILCVFFARNAAMSFNRIADRNLDAANERTRMRELVTGRIPTENAILFMILNVLLFILCTSLINLSCFFLSPLALIIILGYSYTKRWTLLSHFVLGLGLSLSPTGAYLAATGHFDPGTALLSAGVLLWVAGFDIIYAIQDQKADIRLHLHSVPARLGIPAALAISGGVHLVSVGFFILAGILTDSGVWYQAGTFVFAAMMAIQHILVTPRNLSRINLAFFTVNGISGIVFMTFFIIDFIVNH